MKSYLMPFNSKLKKFFIYPNIRKKFRFINELKNGTYSFKTSLMFGFDNDFAIEKVPIHHKTECRKSDCVDPKFFTYNMKCKWDDFCRNHYSRFNECETKVVGPPFVIFSTLYLYIQCVNKGYTTNVFSHKCPNACNAKRCDSQSHTIPDSCVPKGSGVHKNDYDCSCINETIWSTHSKKCYIQNRCKIDFCNGNACVLDLYSDNEKYTCECGEKTMGKRCDEPRNACKENYFKKYKGDDQCKANNGTCVAYLGLNYYTCKCKNNFTDDMKHPGFPNCNKKIDPCASVICHKGYCKIPENDGFNIPSGYCECDEGWEGEKCNIKSPLWLPWTEWTQCQPECGKIRTKTRKRICSEDNSKCLQDRKNTDDITNLKGDNEKLYCPSKPCKNSIEETTYF